MSHRRSALILTIAALITSGAAHAQATRPASPSPVVLPGMPNYCWNYGCGPTAAGMLVGYWQRKDPALYPLIDYRDAQHHPAPVPLDDKLFRGRPASTFFGPFAWDAKHGDAQIDRFIASEGHSRDYWDFLHPAESLLSLGFDPMADRHSDDCLADFLGTSRGATAINGSTLPWDMAPGLEKYCQWRGFTPANGCTIRAATTYLPTFDQLVTEITAGNPVILLVDLKGYWLDLNWHFVTAYGYQNQGPQGQWVAVRDTWKNDRAYASLPLDTKLTDGIRWWKWNTELLSAKTAIRATTTFHLERQPPR
jgi:hypothetical protein